MDQFNNHSKSTVFSPSIFLVHFILFRIHEIGKEKRNDWKSLPSGVFQPLFILEFFRPTCTCTCLSRRERDVWARGRQYMYSKQGYVDFLPGKNKSIKILVVLALIKT